jgi:hypothetical protein
VPLFKEKGEARINAYYSGGEEIEGLELQSALAVGKNIGIMLNTAFLGSGEEGNGFLIEGGAGYYKPISEKIVFETYGGLGFGNAVNNYDGGGISTVNFTKCFIQPSIGFTSKFFDFGVASKISGVFMKLSSENGLIEYYDLIDLDFINSNPNSFLWEPSIFIRFGFQGIKAQLQVTASENMNNKELVQEVVNMSFGISINIKPKAK